MTEMWLYIFFTLKYGLCLFRKRIDGFHVARLTIKLGKSHANSWKETEDY